MKAWNKSCPKNKWVNEHSETRDVIHYTVTTSYSGYSRTPWKIFQDLFGARGCLNIKKKRHLRTIWSKMWTLYLSKQLSTQTGCYAIAACFPFEPLVKCTTFRDIFTGLSRSWNFQEKKSRTFQEAWEGSLVLECWTGLTAASAVWVLAGLLTTRASSAVCTLRGVNLSHTSSSCVIDSSRCAPSRTTPQSSSNVDVWHLNCVQQYLAKLHPVSLGVEHGAQGGHSPVIIKHYLTFPDISVEYLRSIDPRNSSDTKRNACYFSLQYSYILSDQWQLCSSVDSNGIIHYSSPLP